MKKIISGLLFTFLIGGSWSYACSRMAISEEDLRINSKLIVIAKVTNTIHEEFEKVKFEDYLKPDTIYHFEITQTFKGNNSLTGFSMEDESYSSCGYRLQEGGNYLLYLNKNRQKPNFYYASEPPTLIKPTSYTVKPYYNPLREKKRYITYYNIKKEFFNTRRDIRIFLENKRYDLQSQIDYYKYKYSFY